MTNMLLRDNLQAHCDKKSLEQNRRRRTPISKVTISQYHSKISHFLTFCERSGVTTPDQLTPVVLMAYLKTRQPELGDLTFSKLLYTIKEFLTACGRPDLKSAIPRSYTTPEGDAKREPRPFSKEELKRLLDLADPKLRLMIRTGAATGLALADLLSLRKENLQRGRVVTRRLKTGSHISIPIAPDLYQQLELGLPFYAGKSLPAGRAIFGARFRNLCARAEMRHEGQNWHRLRDSFITFALADGQPIEIVAALAGDSVQMIRAHYVSAAALMEVGEPISV